MIVTNMPEYVIQASHTWFSYEGHKTSDDIYLQYQECVDKQNKTILQPMQFQLFKVKQMLINHTVTLYSFEMLRAECCSFFLCLSRVLHFVKNKVPLSTPVIFIQSLRLKAIERKMRVIFILSYFTYSFFSLHINFIQA